MRKTVVFSLVFAILGLPALSGDLRLGQGSYCDWEFSGVIEKGDAEKIASIPIATFGRRLCLDSPGGSLSEGLAMFDHIWQGNLTTAVMPGKTCESACAIAFLGGSTLLGTDVTRQMDRLLWAGATLGFHGPSLDLNSTQSYRDADVNRAFKTAIVAAARLFEVNRTEDRGDRAMTDHLYHRWLNTDFSSMYRIETVGDAILSEIYVAGLNYDFQLRRDHVRNVCDGVFLKGSYPEGSGTSASIHSQFTDTRALLKELQEDVFSEELNILAEIRGDELIAFVGPYYSGTKYHLNGCIVTFDVDSVAGYDLEDYIYESTPISVQIVGYTSEPESIDDVVAMKTDNFGSHNRSHTPIYLFPFDQPLSDLPRNSEHRVASNPAADNSYKEGDDWPSYKMINYLETDLPGGDIGNLSTTDPDECARACLGNANCAAATLDRWNGLCFLKDRSVTNSMYRLQPKAWTLVRARHAFDIPKDPSPPIMQFRANKGFDAFSYDERTTADYDACAASCLADDSCLAVNFRPATRMCSKIASPPEYFTMQGVDMGIKLQTD